MLPDLGFFVTSFTKVVLTGLRVGYLVVPPAYSIRAASILRVSSWSGTYLTGEIATRWVENGTAQRLLEIQRDEAQVRPEHRHRNPRRPYRLHSSALALRLAQGPAALVRRKVWFVRSPTRKSPSRRPNPSLPDRVMVAVFVSVWADA